MSRPMGTPTAAAPYYARFTVVATPAGQLDLTSVATDAPVLIPYAFLRGGGILTCVFSSTDPDTNLEWHLVAYDPAIAAVVGVLPTESATTATARRQAASNGSGQYVSIPVQFDLRSLRLGETLEYYLCLAQASTLANGEFADLVDLHKTTMPL